MARYPVDDVWLREPNLLVPHKKPIGPVQVTEKYGKCDFYLLGNSNHEVTGKNKLDDIGAGIGKAIDPELGITATTRANSDEYARFKNPYVLSGDSDWTLAIQFRLLEALPSYGQILGGNDGVTDPVSRLQRDGSNNSLNFVTEDSNYNKSSTTVPNTFAASGEKQTYVLINKNSILTFVVNGVVDSSANSLAGEVFYLNALYAGRFYSGPTYHFDANWGMFAVFPDSSIPEHVAKILHTDPYQLLVPA